MQLHHPRFFLLAAVTTTVIAVVVPFTSAEAVPDSTAVTFTVAGGSLDITVPGSTGTLGSFDPGADATGQLGAVTVTDTRASLAASWTAAVISSGFVTCAGTDAETIPAADVTYWSGAATSTTGGGTFTPGQADAGAAVAIDASQTAFGYGTSPGNNSAAWDPTLVIAVPDAAVGGLYTGTITHSVA